MLESVSVEGADGHVDVLPALCWRTSPLGSVEGGEELR